MFFSTCSLDFLQKALKRGSDYCLLNVPQKAFGGARCGNGILEAGEECDCGSNTACSNKCCVATTCRLSPQAKCADGECCNLENCMVRDYIFIYRESVYSRSLF